MVDMTLKVCSCSFASSIRRQVDFRVTSQHPCSEGLSQCIRSDADSGARRNAELEPGSNPISDTPVLTGLNKIEQAEVG